MKFISWLKGLSWIAIAGAISAAIMMVLNARRAGKMEADIKHQEARIADLHKGTGHDLDEAVILQLKIVLKKEKARDIRKKSEASLERIGQDETMADIAKRFNGKRVRNRSGNAT